jgi:endonuclease/exonuclease/phosphatase (EEP) superfamily protein YafD
LLSRSPLADVALRESTRGRPTLLATVRVGRDSRGLRIATAHPSAWVAVLGRLHPDARGLAALADDLAAHTPALLCGDLNTTERTWLHRRLVRAGLRGAWRAVGDGYGASWPLFGRWRGFPSSPLVRIDHVLATPELEPVAIRLGPDVGSDHLPLLCDLRWAERYRY